MCGFYDVYVLAPARTADAVDRFLARFAPHRVESADEYQVPQYDENPTATFNAAEDAVAYCIVHPAESLNLYWRCLGENDPAHAMVFFTADGSLILGLSVSEKSERWLADLLAATGGTTGAVAFEEPPPGTADEFLAWAEQRAGMSGQ
jgi:hypothetical protein